MVKIFDKVIRIKISDIARQPKNSNVLSDKEFRKLKQSIEKDGFVDPIKVVRVGKKYLVQDGHHRLKAMEELGEKYISAIVVESKNKADDILKAIHYNTVRGSQNPKVLAELVKEAMNAGLSLMEIQEKLIYDEPTLKDTLDLLELPDDLDDIIKEQEKKEKETMPEIFTFVVNKEYAKDVRKFFGDGANRGNKLGELVREKLDEQEKSK